jgi:hypothetical protein
MHPWRHYSTSPLFLKILSWLTVLGCGFVIFHFYMLWTDYEPQRWVQELYFNLLCGLPFFLFLTGTLIHDKKLRVLTGIFFGVFTICYFLNVLNAWDYLAIGGLQWPLGVSLLGLFIVYLVHFSRKKIMLLEIVKLLWFISISYSFLAQRFIPGGGKAGYFLLASMFLFPLMMALGFWKYFRKPVEVNL